MAHSQHGVYAPHILASYSSGGLSGSNNSTLLHTPNHSLNHPTLATAAVNLTPAANSAPRRSSYNDSENPSYYSEEDSDGSSDLTSTNRSAAMQITRPNVEGSILPAISVSNSAPSANASNSIPSTVSTSFTSTSSSIGKVRKATSKRSSEFNGSPSFEGGGGGTGDNIKVRRQLRKNDREKQRRTELNDKFDVLQELLQLRQTDKAKIEKTTILIEGISLILKQRKENMELKSDLLQHQSDYNQFIQYIQTHVPVQHEFYSVAQQFFPTLRNISNRNNNPQMAMKSPMVSPAMAPAQAQAMTPATSISSPAMRPSVLNLPLTNQQGQNNPNNMISPAPMPYYPGNVAHSHPPHVIMVPAQAPQQSPALPIMANTSTHNNINPINSMNNLSMNPHSLGSLSSMHQHNPALAMHPHSLPHNKIMQTHGQNPILSLSSPHSGSAKPNSTPYHSASLMPGAGIISNTVETARLQLQAQLDAQQQQAAAEAKRTLINSAGNTPNPRNSWAIKQEGRESAISPTPAMMTAYHQQASNNQPLFSANYSASSAALHQLTNTGNSAASQRNNRVYNPAMTSSGNLSGVNSPTSPPSGLQQNNNNNNNSNMPIPDRRHSALATGSSGSDNSRSRDNSNSGKMLNKSMSRGDSMMLRSASNSLAFNTEFKPLSYSDILPGHHDSSAIGSLIDTTMTPNAQAGSNLDNIFDSSFQMEYNENDANNFIS
jgi:hypothetical protein